MLVLVLPLLLRGCCAEGSARPVLSGRAAPEHCAAPDAEARNLLPNPACRWCLMRRLAASCLAGCL